MGCFDYLFCCFGGKKEMEAEIVKVIARPRSPLSEEELLRHLREEGIVPDRRGSGGVAFSIGADRTILARPPRRLTRLATPRRYTSFEKHVMADLHRYDKLVDDVQRKAIERDTKHYLAKKKRTTQDNDIRMGAARKLRMREERLRKLEEERSSKRKEKK